MQEFETLSFEEKAQYTLAKGKLLAFRELGPYQIHLYTVHGFFVEIWYNATPSTISAIISFNNHDLLNTYLKNFSLEKLL